MISVFCVSCFTQKKVADTKCLSKEMVKMLIEGEIKTFGKKRPFFLDKEIATSARRNKIESFLKGSSLELMTRIDIKSQKEDIDFTKFFSDEDFNYMKCQLKESNIKDWRVILPRRYFKDNDNIKKTIEQYKSVYDIAKSKERDKIIQYRRGFYKYSIPLFNKSGNYALVYRETISSGNLWLLKKENDQWVHYAVLLLWTSG